jgi:hypothetical protein
MRAKTLNDLPIKLTLAGNAASKIIDKYGITSSEHIRLRDIAFREGAFVIEEPVARATASLVKSKNGATIRISPFDRPERKRFSIAHELGHLKLNHVEGKLQKACTEKDMRSWYKKSIETEANYFASELILPTTLIGRMCDVEEVDFEPVKNVLSYIRRRGKFFGLAKVLIGSHLFKAVKSLRVEQRFTIFLKGKNCTKSQLRLKQTLGLTAISMMSIL